MPTPSSKIGIPLHKLTRPRTVKAPSPKPASVVPKPVTAKNVAISMKRFNEILKLRPPHYKVVKGGGKNNILTKKGKRLIKFQPVLTPITEEHPSEINRSPILHRSRKNRSPERPIPPPPSRRPTLKHSSASRGGARRRTLRK